MYLIGNRGVWTHRNATAGEESQLPAILTNSEYIRT